ncbi:MAG: hypothetical protein EBU66_15095 [Bacteroidetes bacterium]|nr:hypothetical protein [Bacteroidota bacterium]
MSDSNIFNNDKYNNSNIVNYTLNETITQPGYIITNQQGTNTSNEEITHTTFISTNTSNIININENLIATVNTYNDELSGASSILYSQISEYASKIKCSSFHGKGTIDNYNEIFKAASSIANDSKQMQLNVDVSGFSEIGTAAESLSELFTGFINKLENISIIDDTNFLTAVVDALSKIYNLSLVFAKFKETIIATSTVSLPKSVHDTSLLLTDAMNEINCAIEHINYFASPGSNVLQDAVLSETDSNIINAAVHTINNWNTLCEQGVTIAMSNDSDIQNIISINTDLHTRTLSINQATNIIRERLHSYKLN